MGGSFLLSLTGQIEWIDICSSYGSYHCDFDILTGPNWKLLSGSESGITQHLIPSFTRSKLAINFPIEVIYKSTSPSGWPQITVSVYSGNKLQGFGRVYAPLQPGRHILNSVLIKPVPSSIWDTVAQFFGYEPEYFTSSNLATNNLLKTESFGNMQISLNVLMQNFQSCGYDTGSAQPQHF